MKPRRPQQNQTRRKRASEDSELGVPLTIDQCVENILPVLLHQVVDVTEDSAVARRVVSGNVAMFPGAWPLSFCACACAVVVYSCRVGAVGTYHMAKKRKRRVDYKWEAIVGLSVGVNWQQGQDNGKGERRWYGQDM